MSLFKRHKHQWSTWSVLEGTKSNGKVSFACTWQTRYCQDPTCGYKQIEEFN